jgi:NADH-quinone oxidoreductase subunit N
MMPTPADLRLLSPELVVTVTGLLVLLLDLLPVGRNRTFLTGLGLAGAVLALGLNLGQAGTRALAFGQLHVVDNYAVFFKAVFLASAIIVMLAAARFLEDRGLGAGEFNALLLFATLGTMLMASAHDLLSLFIGIETMSICTYVLCGYMKQDRRCSEGALKYLLMGTFSTGVILYGMVLLYGATGTTGLPAIGRAVGMQGAQNPAVMLAMVLLAAGFGFKIAAVPFHMYLPDMYEGAPTPVVAFMAGAAELAGAAVLVRVFWMALPGLQLDWSLLLWVLAVLTMTIGNLIAIVQTNIKRMLAYSTISHMGYLLMGPVAGSALGVSAVLFYSLVYALMTIGAFGVVILIGREAVRGDQIEDFSGLAERSPLAAAAMLLFLLSLTGIPPTAGFVGKFYLFAAAVEGGYIWLVLIALVNSAISLFYYMRVAAAMYMRELPSRGLALSPSLALHAALALAAFGTLLLGIYPGPLLEMARASVIAIAG